MIIDLLKKLFNRLHVHVWEPTRYNPYGGITELHCQICGKYQHHTIEDVDGWAINWRDGRHPAEKPTIDDIRKEMNEASHIGAHTVMNREIGEE